jgi:hypothetical protein
MNYPMRIEETNNNDYRPSPERPLGSWAQIAASVVLRRGYHGFGGQYLSIRSISFAVGVVPMVISLVSISKIALRGCKNSLTRASSVHADFLCPDDFGELYIKGSMCIWR